MLCTTNAMADACWEIKNCTGNACQKSAGSDSPSDARYFLCGGKNGCVNGAIISSTADSPKMEYYQCDGNEWTKLSATELPNQLKNIPDCDNSYSGREENKLHSLSDDEYDFFTNVKDGAHNDRSDICKKVKQAKDTKPKAKEIITPEPVETSVETPTETPVETPKQQPEQPTVEPAAKAAVAPTKADNITISGTVVDENGEPMSFVNIAEVNSINSAHPNGTMTDAEGKFTLTNLNADDNIQFSFVGFGAKKFSVAELQNNPNVQLKATAEELNEVTISPCADGENFIPETGECVKTPAEPETPIEPKQPKPKEPVIDETAQEVTAPKPTVAELEEKLKAAQKELDAARDAENSWANRGVTAASSAMTGLGGMAAASAIAEQRADAEAEKEMRAYIETMKCEYGNGQNVKLGNEEITLPGGNELLDYYTEYKQLADNLKTTKAALGLRSGIESEVLYDRAQSGLYQYASIGKTGGAETSLYRALTDKESEDAVAWAEQKEKSAKQLKTGGLVGAGGVGAGLLGDAAINTDMIKNIKEVFKK
ncbi:MAG: carboxypeptidase-like regulatory domain-containing protein [Alphaproteobacteria bacterium]|nr:carboxypeptidase-like regulatory domain-containing protein [Alphaproteobacteria bacterium]